MRFVVPGAQFLAQSAKAAEGDKKMWERFKDCCPSCHSAPMTSAVPDGPILHCRNCGAVVEA